MNNGSRLPNSCFFSPRLWSSRCSDRRHRLSHAARGRRQIGDQAGAPSGLGAICKHAAAGFHALEQQTARQASIVTFDGKTVQDAITAACEGGRVSKLQQNNLKMLAEIAESNHVPPLVKLADTRFYAVYDGRTCSVEDNWAHVKHPTPTTQHNRGRHQDY